jgi:putative sigma-54 modulation protein
MRIEYTGRHTQVPDSVKRLGDRKLRKLAKHLDGITDVHVILAVDKRRHTAEVKVLSPHGDLAASAESNDAAISLRTVMDKLIRQAERRVGKQRVRKGGGHSRPTSVRTTPPPAVSAPREAPGPRVIRNRRFAVKPMTIEEAALEVGASADGVLVFRDASTERVNVLYRRKDGNLGLIEPEA